MEVSPALTARPPRLPATEPPRPWRSGAASAEGRGGTERPALAALSTCSAGVGFLATRRRRRSQRLCSATALSDDVEEEKLYDDVARQLQVHTDQPLESLVNRKESLTCPRCGNHERGDRTMLVEVLEGSVFSCRCVGACRFKGKLHQRQAAASQPRLFEAEKSERSQVEDIQKIAENIEKQVLARTQKSLEALAGKTWVNGLLCPRCGGGDKREKTLSVIVDRDNKGDICFGFNCFRKRTCGIGGRVPLAKCHSDNSVAGFPMAVRSAWGENVELDAEFLDYLVKERKIPEHVLRRNHVCQKKGKGNKADAINFQYFVGNEVVAEKLRTLDKRFTQGKVGKCLYGVDDIRGADQVVLTEGEMDKLSVEAAGIQAVASLQNGCSSGVQDGYGAAEALASAQRIILALDGDECGSKATQELAKEFGYAKCFVVNWPEGCKDANDVLRRLGSSELKSLLESASQMQPPHVYSFDARVQCNVADRISGKIPEEFISGVSTGWQDVDRYYKVVPGEVTVITGIPGSGKSEWLLSLAMNLAKSRSWRFLLYAFETDNMFLGVQLLEKKRRSLYTECRDGINSDFGWLEDHFELGCHGYESPTIEEILESAEAEAKSHKGLHGLIIDPYNFIRRDDQESEPHFISTLMGKLRSFAEDHKVHVWICAHPTKSAAWDGERPNMYNIAGSANWYNKTDNGIIIHRKQVVIDGEMRPTRQTQIVIEKIRNKEAGTIGEVVMLFDKERRCYERLPDQKHDDCYERLPDQKHDDCQEQHAPSLQTL